MNQALALGLPACSDLNSVRDRNNRNAIVIATGAMKALLYAKCVRQSYLIR